MKTLFDMDEFYSRRITTDAAARNAIGEVAEMYACAMLDLHPLRVDGRMKVCPDAEDDEGAKYEIKAVGRGRALVYKWRMEKELAEFGEDYIYCFVLHECAITARAGADIVKIFHTTRPAIHLCTLGQLKREVLDKMEPRKFKLFDPLGCGKEVHGSQRKGYIDGGWQFSINKLPVNHTGHVIKYWAGRTIATKITTGG